MTEHRVAILVVLLGAFVAGGGPAVGQLSPGELSRPHAELEGSSNCLKCHEAKRGVAPALCLSCHEVLADRIAAGEGLHAQPDYERCESCHIEHHGRDFELVWWGDEGEEGFDHRLTGYPLVGGHTPLGCRECHRESLLADPDYLRAAGVVLDRTFLGLAAGTCVSCHLDEHRGQFPAETCLDCHVDTSWKPATRFDHALTRYPLTGEHADVECGRCHPTSSDIEGSAAEFVRFKGVLHASCSDCHEDPHRGRLGANCASCHRTDGWGRTDMADFDHGRTRFALRGAHARVDCRSCHSPGRPMAGIRYASCTDCHADVHLGQLSTPGPGVDCKACHTEERFVPSTVTLAAHQETDFPLAGGHLATPCTACHIRVPATEIAGLDSPGLDHGVVAAAETAGVIRFRFATTRCRDCHVDPHAGSSDKVSAELGCETCHVVTAWRSVSFDHGTTEFALEGAHGSVVCSDCHTNRASEGAGLVMSGAPTECSGCHQDIHRGQFDAGGKPADCRSCHRVAGWIPVQFEHDRDSDFRLEGAHSQVVCAECHGLEGSGEDRYVRYKPLPSACSDCHGEEEEG